MRKILTLGAALVAFATVAASAPAADPIAAPFPSTTSGPVFIAAQTVTATGAMQNQFAPGSTVIFRAYAVDSKINKVLVTKDVKYFYVTIPNQPNVKLAYQPKAPGTSGRMLWVGAWKVPSDYPAGLVTFKVLVKTESKRVGQFVQMPVATSQLTIAATPQTTPGPGPASTSAAAVKDTSISLYVDTVNGTQPVGAPKRAVGCSQTNVYKRGEQVVVRVWGFDLSTGTTLSTDNVDTATYTIPGQATAPVTYGAHGAVGAKVFFWSAPWIVPATFPLGDVTIHVAFKTDERQDGDLRLSDHDHPVRDPTSRKGPPTMTTHHSSASSAPSSQLAALLVPATAFARARRRSPHRPIPGVGGTARARSSTRQACREDAAPSRRRPTSQWPARRRRSRAPGCRRTRTSRSPGAPRPSTGCSTRGPTASTTSAARRRSSPSCCAKAQTDAAGAFNVTARRLRTTGAACTTSTRSSTASQVAKGGFLIARHATMTPKTRPDRHADHDHLLRARLRRSTKARSRSTTTTSSPAR